ncbi:MAG: hypothetical protein OEV15_10635 [Gallionella sp.]|nr:hypothetical protein [Gallionella sp.]
MATSRKKSCWRGGLLWRCLKDKNKRGNYWQKLAQDSAATVSDSLGGVEAPHGKERQFKELSDTWAEFKKTCEKNLVPLLVAGKQAEAEKIAQVYRLND